MSKLPIDLEQKLLNGDGTEIEGAPTLQEHLALSYDYRKLQNKLNDINATLDYVLTAATYFKPFLISHLQRASKISLEDVVSKLKSGSWAITGAFAVDLINGNIKTKEIKNSIQTIKDFAVFWKENRETFNTSEDLLSAVSITRISEIDKHRFGQLIATAIYAEKALQNFPDEFVSFIDKLNTILTIEADE